MARAAKRNPATLEKAERAVRQFNKMLPTLEGFIEALTGKHMPVKLSSTTYTDGKAIFVSPPYAFGAEEVHDTRLCDDRDADGVPMCSACDDREKLLALVYHEISHVAFGTFEKLNRPVVTQKIKAIPSIHALPLAKKVDRHLTVSPTRGTIQEVSAIISEYLPLLSNAFEDVRVDTAMKNVRPGTAALQHVLYARIMRDGSEAPDGKRIVWSDQPLNGQATVGMICYALGMPELLDYLDPYIRHVIDSDGQLCDVLDRAPFAVDPNESFVNALEAMIRMQQHGFFDDGDVYIEPEPEPPTEEEDDDEGSKGEDDGVQPEGSDEDPSGGGADTDPTPGGSGGDDGIETDGSPEPGDSGSPEDGTAEGGDDDEHAHGDGSDGDSSDGDAGAVSEGSEEDRGEDAESSASDASGTDDPSEAGEDADGDDGEGADDGDGSGDAGSGTGGGSSVSGVSGTDGGSGGPSSPEDVRDEPTGGEPADVPPPSDFGDASGAADALKSFLGHDEHDKFDDDDREERKAMKDIINTFEHFDAPSATIVSVKIKTNATQFPIPIGSERSVKQFAPESILGPALMVLRKSLEENKRSKMDRNRRSGRVNGRVLGRRAWNDDDRLFQKKTVPGKRDYAVLIGIDISGSTHRSVRSYGTRDAAASYTLCDLSVRAAYAQAEMCSRLGIKFAVYAHTGDYGELVIFEVKSFDAPWNNVAIQKMGLIRSQSANLDGHTMEFYRKAIERVQATDKIIMYYSDGAMPAENYAEELRILKDQIKICKKKDITLMAVGVQTEAPKEHGLDTVSLNSMNDITKVVKHLGDRILKG